MSAALIVIGLLTLVVFIACAAYLETHLSKTVVVPVGLSAILLRSSNMDVLTYKVSVGPTVDHDVVSRELSCVIDAGEPVFSSFPGSTTDLGLVSAPQGASVILALVDIDDAGNRSDAATLEFVAVDTLPPAAPGSFGVTLVGESPAPEVNPEA